jgi:hypothetical protein
MAMLKLLVRDVRVVMWDLWLLAAIYALMSITAARHAQAFFVLGVAFAAVLIVAVPAMEWMFDADRFVCSLPVSRATLVLGRYLSAFGAIALGLVVWMGSAALLSSRYTGADPSLSRWVSVDGAVAYCVILVMLVAIFLPCYFRYGLGKGAAVFSLCVMALSAILAGMRWTVRASMGDAMPDLSTVDFDAVRVLARLFWIAVVAGFTMASAALSIRLYQRREF